jgi:hypothetical protein
MHQHRTTRAAAITLAVFFLLSAPAQASNKVSTPDVEKGQMELEYRGGYDWDDTTKKDRQVVNKFIVNYGVTDRIRLETKLDSGGLDNHQEWTTWELSARYQIFKEKEAWAKLSFEEGYKIALMENKPDILEEKILAQKDVGKVANILNVMFDNEVGDHATGGTDLSIGWKSKYKLLPYLEPGGEVYADWGKWSGTNVKKYQIGPTLSGKITGTGFKYDVGYLFGTNENVADGRFKLILVYAFKPFG